MGILNHTSDGLYSMVTVLYRAIAHLGPQPAEQLVETCSAGIDQTKSGQPKVADALERWVKLGLFNTVSDDVHIAAGCEPIAGADDLALTESLRFAALRIVFLPKNIQDIWSTEGSSDFARGIAWWLAQDVWRVDTSVDALLRLEANQIAHPKRGFVNNDVRMRRLREWAPFLGFAWSTPRGIEIDPTQAICRVLSQVLPIAGEETPTADFLQALASVLPVLDGGSCRRAIEAELKTDVWSSPPPGWVSSSLGRALRRLEHSGRLRLVSRADSGGALRVPGSAGTGARPWTQFTHVARIQVSG